MIRVIARVLINGQLWSEERLIINPERIDEQIRKLGDRHIKLIHENGGLGMVEFEFPDEPDVNQRFFRIGTDPRMMVNPTRWPTASKNSAS